MRNQRRQTFIAITLVVALISSSTVIGYAAFVKYSPGPWTTYDVAGSRFNSRQKITYNWLGSGGLYTYTTSLYIDILDPGDVLDCMQEKAEYSGGNPTYYRAGGTYPLPRYYSTTPLWIDRPWNATHPFVNGQYVKYVNEIRDEIIHDDYPSCGIFSVPGMGGWSSAVNTSHAWSHIHITH